MDLPSCHAIAPAPRDPGPGLWRVWAKRRTRGCGPPTRCQGNTIGSEPRRSPDWPTGWEGVVSSGETNRWVRAHLLHGPSSAGVTDHLHGPGSLRENIIISDKSLNGNMFQRAEETPSVACASSIRSCATRSASIRSLAPTPGPFSPNLSVVMSEATHGWQTSDPRPARWAGRRRVGGIYPPDSVAQPPPSPRPASAFKPSTLFLGPASGSASDRAIDRALSLAVEGTAFALFWRRESCGRRGRA